MVTLTLRYESANHEYCKLWYEYAVWCGLPKSQPYPNPHYRLKAPQVNPYLCKSLLIVHEGGGQSMYVLSLLLYPEMECLHLSAVLVLGSVLHLGDVATPWGLQPSPGPCVPIAQVGGKWYGWAYLGVPRILILLYCTCHNYNNWM